MKNISLIDKKQEFAEKYGSRKGGGGCRHIIAGIKRGLAQGELSGIKRAAYHLHNNSGQAPQLVAHLNNLIGHRALHFRWLPGSQNQSGKLLIRNQSVGLMINAAPEPALVGIVMTPDKDFPCSSLAPESALSLLSRQAGNRQIGIVQRAWQCHAPTETDCLNFDPAAANEADAAGTSNPNLQLVPV